MSLHFNLKALKNRKYKIIPFFNNKNNNNNNNKGGTS